MADVIQTAPSVLSPISPNENRKRRHGYGDATGGDGCGGSWFKRHRTGSSFARRLLHLRGFSVDVRQAEELVRFIDQLPQEMDKDVSNILEKCGDIDDAIRQLTSLKLTFEAGKAASEASAGGGADVSPPSEAATAATADGKVAAAAAGLGAAAGGAANAAQQQQGAPPPTAAAPATCVLSQEWVTALVQEMSSSTNVPDAHNRATRVLQAFEAAVRGAVAGGRADAAGVPGGADARAHAENLARENVILKRAVAIQNARQQEAGQMQAQVAELQRACAQYQEQLQQAQRQNYSLSLHLKEAMSPSPGNGFNQRNPDVY